MNFLAKVLRALVVALVFALAWGLFAWLCSGRLGDAAVLAGISLVVAPLFVPDIIFAWARLTGRLRPLVLSQTSPLRDLVLQCVLREGSLRPRFWILDAAEDHGFLWFERGWGNTRGQDIVLSRAWYDGLPEASRFKEFRSLWSDIASMAPAERRLRSVQFRVWVGAFCMLDRLFDILYFVMSSVGLREMPHPAFWCQRCAWSLKRLCFGVEMRTFSTDPFEKHALRVDAEPSYWRSWVFGVWSRYPTRCLHPSWRILVETSALIES